MALEIQGKIVDIYDTQQISERFKKREFVLETDERGYQQYIKFQLNQDKCDIIDEYKNGDEVKVAFNLTGKPYTRKTGEKDYITNIVAWKIDRLGAPSQSEPPVFNMENMESDGSDLPF